MRTYPTVVRILVNDDGEKQQNPKWHYAVTWHGSGHHAFCTGEYFGMGEGAAKFETKTGKITCPDCIRTIKLIKDINL